MLPNQVPQQQAGAPGAPAQERPNPEQVKATLVDVLKQVAQVAQQNGLDFNELVAMAAGGGKAVPPPPV